MSRDQEKRTVSIRLRGDLSERLNRLAAGTQRNKTWFVELCLAAHLPELEKEYAEEIRRLASYPAHREESARVEERLKTL
jgi:predicted DNA-binding protein